MMTAYRLLESGQYSDFSIKCGSYEWKVHRSIICPQAGFFRRMCDWDFKVHLGVLCMDLVDCAHIWHQEFADKSVTLFEDDPKLVARVLLCLYTGRYPICRHDTPQYCQPYDDFLEARRRLGILIDIDESDDSNVCHDLSFHAGLLKVADKYEVPDLARKTAEQTLGGI